jgi:hypothetical protein
MLVHLGFLLANTALLNVVLAACGALLAIRVHSVYAIYIVAAALRLATTLVIGGATAFAHHGMNTTASADWIPLVYGVAGMAWVQNLLSPSLTLIAIVAPVLWHLRQAPQNPTQQT